MITIHPLAGSQPCQKNKNWMEVVSSKNPRNVRPPDDGGSNEERTADVNTVRGRVLTAKRLSDKSPLIVLLEYKGGPNGERK